MGGHFIQKLDLLSRDMFLKLRRKFVFQISNGWVGHR